jgi:hypothetical protein
VLLSPSIRHARRGGGPEGRDDRQTGEAARTWLDGVTHQGSPGARCIGSSRGQADPRAPPSPRPGVLALRFSHQGCPRARAPAEGLRVSDGAGDEGLRDGRGRLSALAARGVPDLRDAFRDAFNWQRRRQAYHHADGTACRLPAEKARHG